MNLKEAFRYQNLLTELSARAREYLGVKANVIKARQIHKRNEVNPEVPDLEKEDDVVRLYDPNRVIQLLIDLIEEKERLTVAINEAKAECHVDIDGLVEGNKLRQNAISRLELIKNIRVEPSTETGRGYKFNAEGNQVSYYYDIESLPERLFDIEDVKKKIRDLRAVSESVSNQVDVLRVTTLVDFEPMFPITATFEEIME